MLLSRLAPWLTPLPFFRTAAMSTLASPERPASFVASLGAPPLHLFTANTPNGQKTNILLEELRLAYPDKKEVGYDYVRVNLAKNEQKTPDFLKVNPNGRIPALLDTNVNPPKGHRVFESASILLWLVENYDTEFKLSFSDPLLRSEALSWIFFTHGGVGPMFGQAGHFLHAPEKIPYAIKRYTDEMRRLLSVFEDHLAPGRTYLVDDRFSVADINAITWVKGASRAGIELDKEFPAVNGWIERSFARKGVQNGVGLLAEPAHAL
ncbi:PFAM Glutathione S-transferase domain [Vanrija albida]|uniref:PFAM Glutathione S-transferase domain n=1 Tax=Vanrija albida TaxID=181172 RepID=A0ABR3QBM1_9TREE